MGGGRLAPLSSLLSPLQRCFLRAAAMSRIPKGNVTAAKVPPPLTVTNTSTSTTTPQYTPSKVVHSFLPPSAYSRVQTDLACTNALFSHERYITYKMVSMGCQILSRPWVQQHRVEWGKGLVFDTPCRLF